MNETFDLTNRAQRYRACKKFELTYLRDESVLPLFDELEK